MFEADGTAQQQVASPEAEQKLSSRPTYAADSMTRLVLRDLNANAELVAIRIPETSPAYSGFEMREAMRGDECPKSQT